MKNKFNMTQADNIFFANRLREDIVYSISNLVGIAVTFRDTVDILNDVNLKSFRPFELCEILTINSTWQYIVENINQELNLDYIKKFYYFIKNYTVNIKTDYLSELNYFDIQDKFLELQKIENNTDRALSTLIYLLRCQIFKKSNLILAVLICNKILIEKGNGLFIIPVELISEFKSRLNECNNLNNSIDFKSWLYDNCIVGV